MMKIFLINLDKDKERLKHATQQADRFGYNYERISGIYGKTLSPAKLKESVRKFRWWCIVGKWPNVGEVGCALTHMGIYRQMVKNKTSYVCILEDDVVVFENFNTVLGQIEEWINPQKPIVVLLHVEEPKESDYTQTVFERCSCTFACSYVITLEAAKRILKINYPLKVPCDSWPKWDSEGHIELWRSPRACWHNNAYTGFESSIAATEEL